MNKKTVSTQGFTLIEVAIVMIIGSIIIVSLLNYVSTSLKNAQQKETSNKMELIQTELELFLERNGRYPCPAVMTAAADIATFGVEQTSVCTGGGNAVTVGALPVRTLNLPDNMIFDSYRNRFIYAVTDPLTRAANYTINGGAITVQDTGGNDVILPSGSGHYVIVSPGKNGYGGSNALTGALGAPCATGSADEQENCDGDGTFISSILNSDINFDDRLVARGAPTMVRAIPSGALIDFLLGSCPSGWVSETGLGSGAAGTVRCRKN